MRFARTFAPSFASLLSRTCIGLMVACAWCSPASAQDPSDYLLQTGRPSLAPVDTFPGGTINLANGNLHIEIPLGSYSQRGTAPVTIKLTYDSRIWSLGPGGAQNSTGVPTQNANDPLVQELPYFGWRIVGLPTINVDHAFYGSGDTAITCGTTQTQALNGFLVWTAPDGVPHQFQHFSTNGTLTCMNGAPQLDSYAIDGSGYHLFTYYGLSGTNCNASGCTPYWFGYTRIYAKDGKLVYSSPALNSDSSKTYSSYDPNGNILSMHYPAGPISPCSYPRILTDTLGRTAMTGNCQSATQTLYVPNSQNTTTSVTLKIGSMGTLYMPYGLSSPCYDTVGGNSGPCQFPQALIQSITLADGSTYGFTYDCGTNLGGSQAACSNTTATYSNPGDVYGVMTSMTLPGGGTVNFSYSDFTDSYIASATQGRINRWLTGVSYGGAQWTYTPATGCGSFCQTVTVARPSGAHEVYTFDTSSGKAALNTEIQYYSGAVGSTPSLTIQNVFGGLTHPNSVNPTCPAFTQTNCLYPHLNSMTYTVVSPAGNLVSQTTYTYDMFSVGNAYPNNQPVTTGKLLSKSEYGFGLGSAGPLERKTTFSYLDDAKPAYKAPGLIILNNNSSLSGITTNFMDRVVDMQVQDGSGNIIAETKTSYDSTPLASVTGIQNHDDPDFGSGYTTRGNRTQVQKLLNGSFLTVATAAYDTTGQVTQIQDANGNATSFSYSDKFYADASPAANPPAPFTPTNATNAYPTKTTLPIIGSSTAGYYYGSGKQAFSIDQNGADTYSHFLDPLDRNTHSYLPITNGNRGWSLTTYAAGGSQTDTYSAINDTAPSASCTSCLHTRSIADSFGRASQNTLVSDPDGPVTTAITYDSSGRTHTVSNPYRSTTEPTYGLTTYTFDALGRTTVISEADGSTVKAYYGADVAGTGLGGLSAQLCSPATYGYGYPILGIDEAGKRRQTWTDALGHTIEVDEPDSSGTLSLATCYTYDTLDNLTIVQQKGGSTDTTQWRTRNFTYDSLSRLTTATEPESGARTYTYDNNGNVLTKTSPAPNQIGSATVTVSYCYDALNRLTAKGYTFSPNAVPTCSNGTLPSPVATYFYDQSAGVNGLSITNGMGRRTGMTDTDTSESWSYDTVGRLLSDQRGYGSSAVTTSYTYSLGGSIATLNGLIYATGGAGRPVSLVDGSNDAYVTNVHYTPAGDLASIQNASNIVTTYVYDNRLQPCWIYATTGTPLQWNSTQCTASATPGNIMDLKFNFGLGAGDNGNVLSVTNNRDNTRSQNFTYDYLNRLATAQTQTSGVTIPNSNCWGFTFGYDSWGNLLSSSTTGPSGCSEPLPLKVTANSNNQISGYCYDSAGNLLDAGPCGTPHAYTYDAENNLSSAAGSNYVYDGDGRRVWKWTYVTQCVKNAIGTNPKPGGCPIGYHPVTVKQYLPNYVYGGNSVPLREVDPAHSQGTLLIPSTSVNYTFFAGRRIAKLGALGSEVSGFAPSFYFGDHLDTARVVTDVSGNIQDDADFYPFGGERDALNPTSGNHYKFTGYERDSESGLDYASTRHFSSTMGRFMSPDPLSGFPGNPQSWNRYSYVYNNPLNGIDPSGMCGEEDGWSGCDWDWGSPDVYGWFWYSAADASFYDLSTNPMTGAYDPSTSFMQSAGLSSQYNFQQMWNNATDYLNWTGAYFNALGQNLNPFNPNGTFSKEANAIGQSLGGMATGNWAQVANSYNNNPLGLTAGYANSSSLIDKYLGYYGTRGALIGSGVAATSAGTLSVLDALGVTNLGEWEVGWKGGEFTLKDPTSPFKGPDFRFNPLGDWDSSNPNARPPHWHQRPGIGRHLPWDWWF